MEALLEKIGQLAIFLICAQTLVHFRAKESYEKYIKLLVSMMLLILLVEPIMDLFGKEDKGAFLEQVQWYEQRLQEIVTAPELENHEIQQILQNITQERVEEGYAYLQEIQTDTQEKAVTGDLSSGEERLETEAVLHIQDAEKEREVRVEVTPIAIEKVEIGARYGKSGENP